MSKANVTEFDSDFQDLANCCYYRDLSARPTKDHPRRDANRWLLCMLTAAQQHVVLSSQHQQQLLLTAKLIHQVEVHIHSTYT